MPQAAKQTRRAVLAGAAAAAAAPLVEVFDLIEQGTDEWFDLRLGIPTASNFKLVMADGRDGEESKGRTEYLYKLAGELLTGSPAEGSGRGKFLTAAMQRGNDMEPAARDYFERTNFGVELSRVGFIRRRLPSGRFCGTSPDAMIIGKKRKSLEIKTMAPHLMIPRLVKGAGMPPEHRAQVHGTMWVGDLEEVDLLLFYGGKRTLASKFTIARDETYCKEIDKAVQVFDYELNELVLKLKKMGVAPQ